jgi:hypothetical protein
MPNRDTADAGLLCPSSHPGVADCRVLGVVQQGENGPEVAYLNEHVAATPEVLALAAPANPGEVFRLAGTCQTSACPHFDGADCRLATRIVETLPPVVMALPPCLIRRDCRWFHQEGAAACRRCPQVVTVSYQATDTLQRVAGVPPVAD